MAVAGEKATRSAAAVFGQSLLFKFLSAGIDSLEFTSTILNENGSQQRKPANGSLAFLGVCGQFRPPST